MPYWAAQLQPSRTRLAIHFLELFHYSTYLPRISSRRRDSPEPLFPGYCFVVACSRWWDAHHCPGVRRLIMYGDRPAEIADSVVDEIRRREGRDGLIKLPKARGLQPGDRVRIVRGAFEGKLAVYAGMNGHQRVAVLLAMLGSERRVLLPRNAVRAMC